MLCFYALLSGFLSPCAISISLPTLCCRFLFSATLYYARSAYCCWFTIFCVCFIPRRYHTLAAGASLIGIGLPELCILCPLYPNSTAYTFTQSTATIFPLIGIGWKVNISLFAIPARHYLGTFNWYWNVFSLRFILFGIYSATLFYIFPYFLCVSVHYTACFIFSPTPSYIFYATLYFYAIPTPSQSSSIRHFSSNFHSAQYSLRFIIVLLRRQQHLF